MKMAPVIQQRFNSVCGTSSNKKTRKDTQIIFYKAVMTSTDLYGCEMWMMRESDKKDNSNF